MWQWLNHTNSASSDHGFPWQELRFFSTDIWPFDEIPQCNRTWNSQRFHIMCQRMTHYFHRQLRTQFKKHLCFRVLRSRVLLGSLESSPGSLGVFVLQMLLVFVARPVLWNLSTSAKSVGSVCHAAYNHVHSIHSATKTHRFQPTHLPKRSDSVLENQLRCVQMNVVRE